MGRGRSQWTAGVRVARATADQADTVQALGENLLLTASEDLSARLREVARLWRQTGCPDLPAYRLALRQHGADWLVRLSVP